MKATWLLWGSQLRDLQAAHQLEAGKAQSASGGILENKWGRKRHKEVHAKKQTGKQRLLFFFFLMVWNLTHDFSVSEAEQYGLLCQERERSKPLQALSQEGQYRQTCTHSSLRQGTAFCSSIHPPAPPCSTSGALSVPSGH